MADLKEEKSLRAEQLGKKRRKWPRKGSENHKAGKSRAERLRDIGTGFSKALVKMCHGPERERECIIRHEQWQSEYAEKKVRE